MKQVLRLLGLVIAFPAVAVLGIACLIEPGIIEDMREDAK